MCINLIDAHIGPVEEMPVTLGPFRRERQVPSGVEEDTAAVLLRANRPEEKPV